MFENFADSFIDTSGARIRVRHGGSGAPLLLLHGNPQTHVCWPKIANQLADRYHVMATDLRGWGNSSVPGPGATCSNYSFRAMAQDRIEVMQALGYDKFHSAGHDRSGRPFSSERAATLAQSPNLSTAAQLISRPKPGASGSRSIQMEELGATGGSGAYPANAGRQEALHLRPIPRRVV
jgi:hypothetical protein